MYVVKWFMGVYIFDGKLVDVKSGQVMRPVAFSFMFPVFIVANFYVASLLGVIRIAIAVCIKMLEAVRLDRPAADVADGGHSSFLSVVTMASHEYNPIRRVGLRMITGTLGDADHSSSGRSVYAAWRRIQDPEANHTRGKRSVARKRWDLAITLIRNPTLQSHRCHAAPVSRDEMEEAQMKAASSPISISMGRIELAQVTDASGFSPGSEGRQRIVHRSSATDRLLDEGSDLP